MRARPVKKLSARAWGGAKKAQPTLPPKPKTCAPVAELL
jgi:hypothetical protein